MAEGNAPAAPGAPCNPMRVLIVTPSLADSGIAAEFLRAEGIEAQACSSLQELIPQLDEGLGCLVLVEEALVEPDIGYFQQAVQAQPPWSDLPLLLIAGQETPLSALIDRVFPQSGNITLLQRPLHPVGLVSAVNVALRARARQLEVRDLLNERSLALRNRDEFLAMLAHELRNPLAPIRNAVYLMNQLDIQQPLFMKCRAMIDKQAQHITRLVDDLLDVSRLELGKVELRLQAVDVNQSIAAAGEACLAMVSSHGHTLHVRVAPEPLAILADPVRLEQVFGNLLVNAAKFTPAGGTITIAAMRDGAEAVVNVEDNGIGVKPEMLDAVFDLFIQDNSTIARTEGGLGIGLTLVKRLVDLHGGSVRLRSAGLGRGSTFELRFPATLAAGAAVPAPPGRPAAAAHQRILVVEDSADIRESLRMLMAIWQHEVSFAADGPEGVTRARAEQPDIALIDIGLPGLDGYEVARTIRSSGLLPWSKRVKLIALTGYGQATDRDKAAAAGFDMHLLKPVDPAHLESLLRNHCAA
jgi:signal transduction histidine kinase/ActR/RegA family two-component response regulator